MDLHLSDNTNPAASKGVVSWITVVVALLGSLALGLAPAAAATCEDLAGLKLPDTTITLAQTVAAGAFTPPTRVPSFPEVGYPYKNLPAFCRVAGVIKPSGDSDIQFEVWMPSSEWNGKLRGVGNGGFAGSIMYTGLALPLSRNFAVAATDTGHSGLDAGWALGHPQKVIDYGYRAIHETAVKAKAIIEAFYGKGPQLSYFSSCSNGGRQALMEAQRYPEDYNGIIVGAPANYFTHLLEGFIWDLQALSEPGSYISDAKLKAIQAAALAACDAGDGVTDGVIEDPRKCNFDPTVLLCKGPESDSCLTAPQLTALKKIYAGPANSQGVQVFPGYAPGDEDGKGGWGPWISGQKLGGSLQAFFGTQAMTNMVYENRSWDYKTANFDKVVKDTDDKMSPLLNATDPNLKPFERRGGKLIMYHGWNDAAIAPQNAINYFESVMAKLGHRGTDKFMRLYMVPGLEHCGGGPGANVFGEGGAKLGGDPKNDIELALERWVEKGVAPNDIIATKYVNDADPSKGVQRTRPLCPFPLVARYKGTGSTDEAANFVCAKE